MRYFEDKCARCHGPVGSPNNSAFEHALADAELASAVKRMCDGPSQAPIDGINLKALTALVGARQKAMPFICWTKLDGQKISGETLAGTELTIKVGNKTAMLKLEGTDWSYELPKKAKPSDAVLTATFEKQTVTLDLSKASFTN